MVRDKVGAADVVALARTSTKASESDLGVTAREADYSKPETLDKALKGVDTPFVHLFQRGGPACCPAS